MRRNRSIFARIRDVFVPSNLGCLITFDALMANLHQQVVKTVLCTENGNYFDPDTQRKPPS